MPESIELNSTARVAKNSLVQLLGGLLSKIMGVLLVVYAARQLGTESFGVYSFILSLLGIFYVLTDFGVGILTTRDLARDFSLESQYLGNILAMRVLLSIVAAGVMVGTTWLLGHPPAIVQLAAIAALSMFFTSNVDTCASLFYAHQRMEIPATVSVVVTLVRVGASLGALASGAGVFVLILIYTGAAALQMTLLLVLISSRTRLSLAWDWPFWRRLMLQAYPLALTYVFSMIYFRIDTVMLASLAGQSAVGLYNAAYRLLEFCMIIPAYYGGAIFPVISASYTANPQRFLLIYRRSLKYMLIASVPMALGASALAPKLIDVLYGPAFAASVPALFVLMWTFILISVNSLHGPYLVVMGKQSRATVLIFIGMVVNIALNFYAIPHYGLVGAAWVTLLSEVLVLGMFVAAVARPLALKFRMLRHALAPLAAGALMFIAVRQIPSWDLGYEITCGAVVYIGLLFAFRAFDEVDWELFGRILHPTSVSKTRVT